MHFHFAPGPRSQYSSRPFVDTNDAFHISFGVDADISMDRTEASDLHQLLGEMLEGLHPMLKPGQRDPRDE